MAILLPTEGLNLSDRGGMGYARGGGVRLQGQAVDARIPFLVKPNQLSTRVLPMINAVDAFQDRVRQRKLEGLQNEAKNGFTEQANKLLIDYREQKLKGAINGIDDYNNQLDDLKKQYSDIFKNHRDFKDSTDKWLDNQTTSYKSTGYDHYSNEVFKQNNVELQARIANTNIAFQNNATSPQAQKFYEEYQEANRNYLQFNGFDLDSEEAQVFLTKANDEAVTQLVNYNCNAEQYGIARNRLETFKNSINGTTYRDLLLKIKDGLEKQAKQAQAERDAKARANEVSTQPLTVQQKIQLKNDFFSKRFDELKAIRANPKADNYEKYKNYSDEQLASLAEADAYMYVSNYDNKLRSINNEDFFTRQAIRSVLGTFSTQQLSQVTSDNIMSLFSPQQQDAVASYYGGNMESAKKMMIEELDNIRSNIGSNTVKNLKSLPKEKAYQLIHDSKWIANNPISIKDENEFNIFKQNLEKDHADGKLKVGNQQAQDIITTNITDAYGKKLENLEPFELDIVSTVNDELNRRIYNLEQSTGKQASADQVLSITQNYFNDPQGFKTLKKQSQQRIDRLEDVFDLFKQGDLLKDNYTDDQIIAKIANLDSEYAQENGGQYPSANQLYNYALDKKAIFLRHDVTYKQYEKAKKQKERDTDSIAIGSYLGEVSDDTEKSNRYSIKSDVVPVEPGNIDLLNRPKVKNKDGSVSTVRSISVSIDGLEVLLPTVINGKVVSAKEAVQHYIKTGEHLGKFKTAKDANKYAKELHEQQEEYYLK